MSYMVGNRSLQPGAARGDIRASARVAWLGLLSCAAALVGCAGAAGSDPYAPGASDLPGASADLIGGDVAPADVAGSVLLVDDRCTAARIGERHLLLAAHCVLTLSGSGRSLLPTLDANYRRGGTVRVTDSNDVTSARYRDLTVVRTHVHPAWLEACGTSGCAFDQSLRGVAPPDIAVIETVEAPPGTIATVDTSFVGAGDALLLVGYGCEKSVNAATAPRRLKFAMADAIHATEDLSGAARRSYFETAGQGSGGAASLCPGDSGGPVFRAGTGARIVGINAYYTFADQTGVSSTNLHTRIGGSAHEVAQWLHRVTRLRAPACEGLLTLEAPNLSALGAVRFADVMNVVRTECVLTGTAPTAAALASRAAELAGSLTMGGYTHALLGAESERQGLDALSDGEFVETVWALGTGRALGEEWARVYGELLTRGELTRAEYVALVADSDEVRALVDTHWL